MAKLTDTQALMLSAAARREDGGITLPATLKGGAAQKVVDGLMRRKLIETIARSGDLPAWRTDAQDGPLALRITDAGRRAIGIEPESDEPAPAPAKATRRRGPAGTGKPARAQRAESKQAQLVAMLRRRGGATLAEIVAATGWQKHTVRGAIAGALKKKLGLAVESAKRADGQRVYRIS